MRFTELISLDQKVRNGINGEYTFRKISIPVPGEDLTLGGLLCTPRDRGEYYYAVEHPKERILLHFTAGHIRSDLSTLTTNKRHVSVPFVIGRDGTIYQLFSSKFFSGNIGKGIGNIDTGNAQDKATISIEISNYGYLAERDGNLETFYSRLTDDFGGKAPVDIYCSLSEKEAYIKQEAPFRGQTYFASYTEAQYNSTIILLRYLTAQYKIPRQFLPEPERYTASENVLLFKGIVSHVNYRAGGKWDIGPAFDWKKLIDGVQADKYVSTANVFERADWEDFGEEGEEIGSEDGMEQYLPKGKDPKTQNESYEEAPGVNI
ncbi:MAG: N-acetylmuramoyl-L-alanine amidase [Chitinophagaceae bacterium]